MKHGRPLSLAALLLMPALLVACGDGGSTTDVPIPSAMQKTAGDDQTGPPGTSLPTRLEVKVTDDQGRAVPDFTVSFATTGGSVNPQSMDTDDGGRARTTLTLPNEGGTVTVTASGAGVPSVQFTAEAVPDQLGFQTSAVPAARTGVPYARSVAATGGSGADYDYEIVAGGLPAGLTLESDGSFSGSTTQTGAFSFTVQVTDGEGETASRPFTLNVCAPPADLAVGDVRVLDPSEFGECGVWIPDHEADRYYRVASIRTNRTAVEDAEREVTTTVAGFGTVDALAVRGAPFAAPTVGRPALDARAATALRRAAARQEATARYHERMLRDAAAMLRRLGPDAVARSSAGPLAVAATDLPQNLQIDVTNASSCQAGEMVTAEKISENDVMAVYQDQAQRNDPAKRVTEGQADMLLGYYEQYGKQVIDAYFDGVDDIDSNGKVIVFVTPEVSNNVLGYVWPGDMFSKSQCAASNEAELIYVGVDEILALTDPAEFSLALATVVHEMKHVSSVYERLQRSGQELHPLWYEEGSAEIASTQAARLAWQDAGGPAVTDRVVEDDWRAAGTGDLTNENFVLLLQLFRLQGALAEQPNSVLVKSHNSDDVYGTGWLFLRWLGDAYGDASSAKFAESSFFAGMNDRASAPGVPGIEAATGVSWETLMEEFTAAIMYNGTPAMDDGPRPITGWDFVGALELWCFAVDPVRFTGSGCDENPDAEPGAPGAFPWPVTTTTDGARQHESLVDGIYRGDSGQGGFRVHDFRTTGTGDGAEITVDVQAPAKVVVIRIR